RKVSSSSSSGGSGCPPPLVDDDDEALGSWPALVPEGAPALSIDSAESVLQRIATAPTQTKPMIAPNRIPRSRAEVRRTRRQRPIAPNTRSAEQLANRAPLPRRAAQAFEKRSELPRGPAPAILELCRGHDISVVVSLLTVTISGSTDLPRITSCL